MAKSWYLSFFSLSFEFSLWSDGLAKSTILKVLLIIIIICYGHISYHTPKMDTSNLNIFSERAKLGEDNFTLSYETFDRQIASRERLVLLLYDFLFSANTITFTYHPLFELFFHRSYLKTTTLLLLLLLLLGRVFSNGRGHRGTIPGKILSKTQKMVLDTSLFNTQH